ncbi:hypothetical protein CR513_31592, partial [Mucuna pruriens]
MEAKLEEAEWMGAHLDQLNLIEGKRLIALYRGDLVLKKILPTQKDHRRKWTPNYERLYVVKRTFSRGTMILTNMDGKELQHLVNLDKFLVVTVETSYNILIDWPTLNTLKAIVSMLHLVMKFPSSYQRVVTIRSSIIGFLKKEADNISTNVELDLIHLLNKAMKPSKNYNMYNLKTTIIKAPKSRNGCKDRTRTI